LCQVEWQTTKPTLGLVAIHGGARPAGNNPLRSGSTQAETPLHAQRCSASCSSSSASEMIARAFGHRINSRERLPILSKRLPIINWRRRRDSSSDIQASSSRTGS
jgi:hypothetical protein